MVVEGRHRTDYVATDPLHWRPMRVRLDGVELFYEVMGEGTTLLLMHGGLGLDHTAFRPWLDPLAERYRLVFYDHRGNGRSSRPESLGGVTHDTWVADADALRRHLGIERLVVLGHSYGGYLALEYALRHPRRVAGLVLCSTAGRALPFDGALARAERTGTPRQVERLRRLLGEGVADDAAFRDLFTDLLPLYFRTPEPEAIRRILAETRFSAAALSHAFAECYPSFDVLARLSRIEAPALVLSGRHDWVFAPEESAEPLRAGIPDARLVVFEESGHYPFIEEQGAFLSALGDWLEGLD